VYRCFLETSAQVIRLTSRGNLFDDVQANIEAAENVGTSSFVNSEFLAVVGRLYDALIASANQLVGPDQPRPFARLTDELADHLPVVLPGGSLHVRVLARLRDRYVDAQSGETPRGLATFLLAEKANLIEAFFFVLGEDLRASSHYFRVSTCCELLEHGASLHLPMGCHICPLLTHLEGCFGEFIGTLRILANANREESPYLLSRLAGIDTWTSVDLRGEICTRPGAYGDLLIFSEAPDHWTILTRDRTFSLLRSIRGGAVKIRTVRFPRIVVNEPCSLRRPDGTQGEGTLMNFSGRDCRVSLPAGWKPSEVAAISSTVVGIDQQVKPVRVTSSSSPNEAVFRFRRTVG
jgi:hypothetical protein